MSVLSQIVLRLNVTHYSLLPQLLAHVIVLFNTPDYEIAAHPARVFP